MNQNSANQTAMPLAPALSQWLDELYTQARQQRLSDFKQWCFSSMQGLLRFDSALWATRSDLQKLKPDHWVDDTCLFKQPDEFMDNYAKVVMSANTPDPLNQHLGGHPGQFFSIWDCCPKTQWYQSDYYLKHCRIFGVENAISALTLPRENSIVRHVFSFYRANVADEFTADETLLANFMLPNLVEAIRINVLSTFSKTQHKGESFRAVLDRYGEILEAETGFCLLMKQKALFDKTQAHETRVDIPGLDQIISSDARTLNGLKTDIVFSDGLFYVEISENSRLGELSMREYQILELISSGLSSKDIAQMLSENDPTQPIKTNTVNTHRANIYRKIGVKHKTAATAYFLTHAVEE